MKSAVKSKGWDWSKVSEKYWGEVSDEFLPVAFKWKKMGKRTALDLGCGIGRHSLFLAELGFDVTAADISLEGIARLQKTAEEKKLDNKIHTVVCDMLNMPFENNFFDCVVAFHSIYHTDYVGLKKVIVEVTHVLKKNGQFYVTFNSKNNPSFHASSNQVIDDYTVIRNYGREQGVPHTFLEYQDIVDLLSSYNLVRVRQIQDYFDNDTSIHFFIEAEKKN